MKRQLKGNLSKMVAHAGQNKLPRAKPWEFAGNQFTLKIWKTPTSWIFCSSLHRIGGWIDRKYRVPFDGDYFNPNADLNERTVLDVPRGMAMYLMAVYQGAELMKRGDPWQIN